MTFGKPTAVSECVSCVRYRYVENYSCYPTEEAQPATVPKRHVEEIQTQIYVYYEAIRSVMSSAVIHIFDGNKKPCTLISYPE